MRPQTAMKLAGWFFTALGLVFLSVAAGLAWTPHLLLAHTATAPGRVVELASHRNADGKLVYRPVIEYQAPDGQTVRFTAASEESRTQDHRPGEAVTVHHLPGSSRQPWLSSLSRSWFAALIFGCFGLVAAGIGQFLLWRPVVRHWHAARLRRIGRRTLARIREVRRDTSLEVNGRSPFRIVAHRLDSRGCTVQVFESDPIWFDPSEQVQLGADVDVMVDPHDATRYWMDTRFLSKER